MARLRARDEAALAELYDELAPWVLGVAYRVLHDLGEAEDVVTEVFTQLWDRIGQHDERRGALTPWVLAMTRHRAVDLLRRRTRWYRRAEQAAPERDAEYTEPATHPDDERLVGWPVHQEVRRAVDELPEDQRRAVLLAYYEGLTHREIARRLDWPLGTVKTRLRLAHHRLAELLAHVEDWIR